MTFSDRLKVLFPCTGNACRSQMAEDAASEEEAHPPTQAVPRNSRRPGPRQGGTMSGALPPARGEWGGRRRAPNGKIQGRNRRAA